MSFYIYIVQPLSSPHKYNNNNMLYYHPHLPDFTIIVRYIIKRQAFPIAKPRESSSFLPNKKNVKNVTIKSPNIKKKY
jgi:hypothetical protein